MVGESSQSLGIIETPAAEWSISLIESHRELNSFIGELFLKFSEINNWLTANLVLNDSHCKI